MLLDEGPAPGGQIYRHLPGREAPAAASAWLARLSRSGARVLSGAAVFDAAREAAGWRLAAQTPERDGRRLGASGRARDRGPRALPAVPRMDPARRDGGRRSAGALEVGGVARGADGGRRRIRPAAAAGRGVAREGGARVVCVAEQAGLRDLAEVRGRAAALARQGRARRRAIARAFARAPYRAGAWIAEARGRERLEAVVVEDARGRRTELACDLAAVGYGLVPNVELARLLGCAVAREGVVVDARQQTAVEGVFCAGEACGVAGVEAAIAEGQIAGAAAAGRLEDAGTSAR